MPHDQTPLKIWGEKKTEFVHINFYLFEPKQCTCKDFSFNWFVEGLKKVHLNFLQVVMTWEMHVTLPDFSKPLAAVRDLAVHALGFTTRQFINH